MIRGVAACGGAEISFSGALGTTGFGTTTLTGTTRTITGSGDIVFTDVLETLGAIEYSYNSGAWTGIGENDILTVSSAATLQMRGTGLAILESVSTNIRYPDGTLIQSVLFARGVA
jgi:hypothetical protein